MLRELRVSCCETMKQGWHTIDPWHDGVGIMVMCAARVFSREYI